MTASFSIAHVTPYPWEAEDNEVNAHVRARRGASSHGAGTACWCSRRRARRSGCAPRARRCAPRARAPDAAPAARAPIGAAPRVIAVGEVLDVARRRRAGGGRRRCRSTWRARSRNCSSTVELDFVHVHEPFAPSTSNAALRHSRALNVGSFHSSSERLLSTLVARRFVESFFGRLDARTASLPATAELMDRHFPGDYRLVPDDDERRERARGASTASSPRAGTPPAGDPELRRAAADAAADRRGPAHAHRPLRRLRHARGGAAGDARASRAWARSR